MAIVELTPKSDLNPFLWSNGTLRPEVRTALIKTAADFKQFVGIPFEVEDIVITGSQVSYFYNKYSDLDLHLIVDYANIDCDTELEELFDTKRLLYNAKTNIKIRGIDVELYVEDKKLPAKGASWSLKDNQWKVEPNPAEFIEIDTTEIDKMYRVWRKIILFIIRSNDAVSAKKLLDLLRKYRKLGLKQTGEYGVANLVYKTLRNAKVVEKLVNYLDQTHDQDLSI
jgi:hypothetical protein